MTNSAAIVTDTTTTDYALRGWGVIQYDFTLPATCEALAFRIIGVLDTADVFVDRLVAFPTGIYEFPLPDWCVYEEQVRGVLESEYTGYVPEEERWCPRQFSLIEDELNPNRKLKLFVPGGAYRPLQLQALRPYTVLSADTDTTTIDRDLIEAGTCFELAQVMWQRTSGPERLEWRDKLSHWKRIYGKLNRACGPEIRSRYEA